ncbi:MAG TPA: hypothetical protein VLA93_15115 [Pyrinomonadaceae bacterium]|nr:hypothetical protein [Pyrinomonadaceae bacterium]
MQLRKGCDEAVRASGENVEGAVALEFEASEQVDAAQSEQTRGSSSISVDLLIDAIEKERDSLDLLEQGVETLRQSLAQRRRSLDQQQEILNALADCLIKEGNKDAARG